MSSYFYYYLLCRIYNVYNHWRYAGAVYLFTRIGGGIILWSQSQVLLASQGTNSDDFGGGALCLCGSVLAVGAKLYDMPGNNAGKDVIRDCV